MAYIRHNQTSYGDIPSFIENIILNIASKQIQADTDWSTGLKATWFLSPRRHAVEFVWCNIIFAVGLVYFWQRAFGIKSLNYKLLNSFKSSTKRSIFEKIAVLLLTSSLVLVIYHKFQKSMQEFLLQPCHMNVVLLIVILCFSSKNSPILQIMFNIYLYNLWATLLALSFPDMRDYKQFLEIENFFLEHYLLFIVPACMILSRRYFVLPFSLNVAVVAALLNGLYHTTVLEISSLISAKNLNYVMSPPPALMSPPFDFMGFNYRIWMHALTLLLTVLSRGFVALSLQFLPHARIAIKMD